MANPSTTATMVGVLVGLTIFSASSVAVRVTLKRRQVKPLCWDDAVLVGAWVRLPARSAALHAEEAQIN